MKNNMRRKETHPHHNPQRLLPRLVFQSFNVHLSLLYKKRPERKANGAEQGELIDNVSKHRKIVGGLFKAK